MTNVLLLCTDQQRYDALGCYGNPHISTPNIDRLAAQGALFERCYVQNPVCGPSRASLMTSRYPRAHGLYSNGVDIAPHEELFTRRLADAGYDCGLVGKFHLGACQFGREEPRLDDGFRVYRWSPVPYPGSSENAYHRWLKARRPDLYDAACDPDSPVTFDSMPTELHYSHWVAEETIDFLTTSRHKTKPFCFVANFFDPHHGFDAPKEYADRYAGAELMPMRTWEGELATKPPIQTEARDGTTLGRDRPGAGQYTAAELARVREAYYAMVTLVDDEVGRILDTLDAEGLADDTLVVFTSDHGELLGDHQLMLKGPMMYDCSVRVPLIARLPGVIPAGTRRDELVQWIDLAPTFLDAAGVAPLAAGQGTSLLPLCRGDAEAVGRGWALCEYRNSGRSFDPPVHLTMLRVDRWKIVVHHGDPATTRERTGELYDMLADPHELANLWDDTEHRAVRTALQERLLDVLVATEDRSRPRISHW